MQSLLSFAPNTFNPVDSAPSSSLMPDMATEPVALFADALRVEMPDETLSEVISLRGDGTLLPGDGKRLPLSVDSPPDDVSDLADAFALEPGVDIDVDLEVDPDGDLETPTLPAGLRLRSAEKKPDNAPGIDPLSGTDRPSDDPVAALINLPAVALDPRVDAPGAAEIPPPQAASVAGEWVKPASVSSTGAPGDRIRAADKAKIDGLPIQTADRLKPLGAGFPPAAMESIAGSELNPDAEFVMRSEGIATEGLRADSNMATKGQVMPGIGAAAASAASVAGAASTLSSTDEASLTPLSDRIEVPVRDAAFGERLGEKVVLMANGRLQNASLQLSPAELGPLRVQVSVDNDVASVNFVANHTATKEAIEAALPRLRAMFEEQGLTLGQTSVGEQSADGDSADDSSERGHFAEDAQVPDGITPETAVTETRVPRGLLDTFV